MLELMSKELWQKHLHFTTFLYKILVSFQAWSEVKHLHHHHHHHHQSSDTGTYICFALEHPPAPGSQVSMYLRVTTSGSYSQSRSFWWGRKVAWWWSPKRSPSGVVWHWCDVMMVTVWWIQFHIISIFICFLHHIVCRKRLLTFLSNWDDLHDSICTISRTERSLLCKYEFIAFVFILKANHMYKLDVAQTGPRQLLYK